jgi:hypothetical protein
MVGSRRRPAREGRRTYQVAAAFMTGCLDRPRASAGGRGINSPNQNCWRAVQSRRPDPILNPQTWLESGWRGQTVRPGAPLCDVFPQKVRQIKGVEPFPIELDESESAQVESSAQEAVHE